MITCPECKKTYNDGVELCQEDGAHLIPLKQETLIGQTIKGRYRVIRELGRGGMGAVYLADQITFGRKVALKVLHEKYAWDEEFVQRFRREAQLTATLNHANVITVHDFDQAENGSLFIAMEYVDGGTLRQMIPGAGLGLAESVRVSVQIAEGLLAAHRLGVIHRDVKPENILISHDGRNVRLTDLGIARIRDAESSTKLTQTGTIVGTPAYMAPEQIQGQEVTAQTDIYAFGIMLYEMLSGKTPFAAASSTALLMQHIAEIPVPLRTHRGEVPVALERLIMQMLEKLPERRPKDIEQVLSGLKILEGSLQHEIRTTVAASLLKPRPKIPGALWAGGILMILIAALVGFKYLSDGGSFFSFARRTHLDTLSVQIAKSEVEIGETLPLKAQARYADGNEIEVAKEVQWSSSDPSTLLILPDGHVEGRLPGSAEISARIGGVSAAPVRVKIVEKPTPEYLSQIQVLSLVLPAEKRRLTVKETRQLRLQARFSDGTARDITDGIEWRSGDAAVVKIRANGEIEAVKAGKTTVIARYNGIDTQALNIEVQGKQLAGRTTPAKKTSAKEATPPDAEDKPQPTESPNQSPVETSAQAPSRDLTQAAPIVPSRDPRDVVLDYIRSEKQRRMK